MAVSPAAPRAALPRNRLRRDKDASRNRSIPSDILFPLSVAWIEPFRRRAAAEDGAERRVARPSSLGWSGLDQAASAANSALGMPMIRASVSRLLCSSPTVRAGPNQLERVLVKVGAGAGVDSAKGRRAFLIKRISCSIRPRPLCDHFRLEGVRSCRTLCLGGVGRFLNRFPFAQPHLGPI